jgi:AcrR family transcriptional regulator
VGSPINEGDPRVKRTRKLLQDALVALLAEKGFQAISVQDITARATVNRATFYAHFADKYDLLDQVISDFFRAAVASRVSPAAPFTADNLELLVSTVLEALGDFHSRCKGTHRDLGPLIEARLQQELAAFLREWLARSWPADRPPGASPDTVAMVFSWSIFGVGSEWGRGPRTRPAAAVAREVTPLLIDGLDRSVLKPAPRRRRPDVAESNPVATSAVPV